ncbi:hypothetical protein FOYG_10677 [Fusarium oxysporum NRRL 32931]|uniref:Uncharacterized protein n=1 Tax=Fusarium oxysporum NRRL 32931 TaxID=660029 RepID=W9HZ18_FUSOX|nr:hypothetical protein FOYG_10677 [Fusarium oxysporum NRRL 32931]
MPIRNSLQPYDYAYCMTSYDLDPAIRPALDAAGKEELKEICTIVAAIRKNFSLRCRSNLVKMAVFDCSLIRLINYTDQRHRISLIDPNWVDSELLGLKDLERDLREGHHLRSDQAAFLAAFTGLVAYKEWLFNVSERVIAVEGELLLNW